MECSCLLDGHHCYNIINLVEVVCIAWSSSLSIAHANNILATLPDSAGRVLSPFEIFFIRAHIAHTCMHSVAHTNCKILHSHWQIFILFSHWTPRKPSSLSSSTSVDIYCKHKYTSYTLWTWFFFSFLILCWRLTPAVVNVSIGPFNSCRVSHWKKPKWFSKLVYQHLCFSSLTAHHWGFLI